MIKNIKTFLVRLFAALNILVVIMMLMVGFVDYVNPVTFHKVSFLGMGFPILLVVNMTFLVFWLLFKWKMVIIPVLGFLIAYVPISIYVPLNLPSTLPDGTIKVMSYNVLGYHDMDGASSFDSIYNYLKNSEADIVCLQEDHGIGGKLRKQMDKLYPHTEKVQVGGAPFFNTLGFYSRYPIIRAERIEYESNGNGSAAFYINVDGDTVIVINNHFESNKLNPDDRDRYKHILKGDVPKEQVTGESKRLLSKLADAAKKRAPQADVVRKYIEDHSQYPIIVCGDFNDNPLSYTRRVVAKDLYDCFVKTGRGLGLTYNRKGFNVRIDYIMCSTHYEPYNCTVDDEMAVSDHNPIFCWMKMQEN